MPEIHAVRRNRLRDLLADRGAEAVLVTRLVNMRYLTGFTGSNGALLLTPDAAVLATDGRYATQSAAQAPDVERVLERAVAPVLARRAASDGVRRLALEEHHVTLELDGVLRSALDEERPGVETVRLRRAVEQLRMVKDDEELDALRTACAVADAALAHLLPGVAPGRTERSLARELETRMVDAGAQAPSFETIVATGPNSAVPHHRPTDRPVARGDFLKIDFGALVDGYHSDCTRTFVVGAVPADWQVEVHALVFAAQKAGREALAVGADVRDVDAAARRVVDDAGYGERFLHGLGHGVGLEIHEAPLVGPTGTGRLLDRTPVTVEPGVYLEGRGGVRIEDTLVVRDSGDDPAGAPELLTTTTKELLVLG